MMNLHAYMYMYTSINSKHVLESDSLGHTVMAWFFCPYCSNDWSLSMKVGGASVDLILTVVLIIHISLIMHETALVYILQNYISILYPVEYSIIQT